MVSFFNETIKDLTDSGTNGLLKIDFLLLKLNMKLLVLSFMDYYPLALMRIKGSKELKFSKKSNIVNTYLNMIFEYFRSIKFNT